MRTSFACTLLLVLAWAIPVRGQTIVQVELDCWAPYQVTAGTSSTVVPEFDRSTGITWAPPTLEQSGIANNPVQSMGFDFTVDDEAEIHCTTILPSDYSTTTLTTPEVTIIGWPNDEGSQWCEPDPDPPCDGGCTSAFVFQVSSRSYAAGDLASAAWSTAVNGLIESQCPWNDPVDRARSVDVEAAAGASSWGADELLFIRIQRLDVVWPDATFHVASVKLRFTQE